MLNKITFELNSDKFNGIATMKDFYNAIGLFDYLHGSDPPLSVYALHANPITTLAIKDLLIKNIPTCPLYKPFVPHVALANVTLDWVNLSPIDDDSVPVNEIWIRED